MAHIFITGSSDGLGKMAAQLLVAEGHKVVLHARTKTRAAAALAAVPGAKTVIVGDLCTIADTILVAEQVNDLGNFDAVIHNAGMGYREQNRNNTAEGLPQLFAVNSLAPYILTCLINRPQRLVYVSSSLHRDADPSLNDITWSNRPWNGFKAYSDSKLQNVLLAFAVARKWPGIYSNALEPGWVATKLGGPEAPDSLEEAPKTQAWLAASNDAEAMVTGKYFYHQKIRKHHLAATDKDVQERFLAACEKLTGIKFPGC